MSNPLADMDKPDVIFCIGTNMTESSPGGGNAPQEGADAKGAKLIVADPRKHPASGSRAPVPAHARGLGRRAAGRDGTRHRPRGLVDREFAGRADRGLRGPVGAPEETSHPSGRRGICGVPARDIEQAALWYGRAERGAIYYTLGVTEHICGVDNVQSLSNLALDDGQRRPRGHRHQPDARPKQHPGRRRLRGLAEQLPRIPTCDRHPPIRPSSRRPGAKRSTLKRASPRCAPLTNAGRRSSPW